MTDTADVDIRELAHRVLTRAIGLSPDSPELSLPTNPVKSSPRESKPVERRIVAIGADHGGFDLKEVLKAELPSLGFDAIDVGTHGKDPVDYPDIAHAVANLVNAGRAELGIIIDGAGIGSCIVANKIPGVRAGMAYDYSSALNSREHNDTNVLTLGGG